jgi:UPF0755 protein
MVPLMSDSPETQDRPVETKKKAVRKKTRRSGKKKPSKKVIRERQSLLRSAAVGLPLLLAGLALALVMQRGDSQAAPQPVSARYESAVLVQQWLSQTHDDQLYFLIPTRQTVQEVCRRLEQEEIPAGVPSRRLVAYLTEAGADKRIQAGAYILDRDITVQSLSQALARGYADTPVLSIYEGMTIAEIDTRLDRLGLADAGEFEKQAEHLAKKRGLPFAEGYLLAGDYVVFDHPAASLASGMLDAMSRALALLHDDISGAHRNEDEIVRVASMVQRETSHIDQMPLIAGIIWNRLDAGMPLGIDATTRYETGDWLSPITREQLADPTPFNTRIEAGLPPSGIGAPATASLNAAVYPLKSDYYYYLHDKQGAIYPSKTYEQHLEHIRTHLK